jgi:Ca2+-binding EF-hand superfamily protein
MGHCKSKLHKDKGHHEEGGIQKSPKECEGSAELKEVFKKNDHDADGFLQKEDLRRMYREHVE